MYRKHIKIHHQVNYYDKYKSVQDIHNCEMSNETHKLSTACRHKCDYTLHTSEGSMLWSKDKLNNLDVRKGKVT